MQVGSLIGHFLSVARDSFFGKGAGHRHDQVNAIFAEDYASYVASKAFEEADQQRAAGHCLQNNRVYEILMAPDHHYCEGESPLNFGKKSFANAERAIVAVRESVRAELGISLPRVAAHELTALKIEELRYER